MVLEPIYFNMVSEPLSCGLQRLCVSSYSVWQFQCSSPPPRNAQNSLQFNMTSVTCWSSSVCRFDNCQSGLIFFLVLAQVGPFYVLALVSPFLKFGSLSALAHCRPLLEFCSFVSPFESAFTNRHISSSLAACQTLSPQAIITIYGLFPALATTMIIISNFKLKVPEYSTLSLRGDVRIFYIILVYYVAVYVLGFSLGFLTYHS